jgi:histidyl-tRNA synthetase
MLRYISEKALRYDLTVPFARYVVQYQHEITFPFKRYQIQPVWRADNPQKGRYREFYQCDADVVGSASLINEIEFVQIFNEVLNDLRLHDFVIKINNRKILTGMAEVIGIADRLIAFTVALDKLDKIGKEKVLAELSAQGFESAQLEKIEQVLDLKGNNTGRLQFLRNFLQSSSIGQKGLDEMEKVLHVSAEMGVQNGEVEFDMSLARGLDYYTGSIFEVKISNSGMGSIAGGGRYDDLTGIFGMPGISGVGISFGADRIYDILLARDLYPESNAERCKFLFLNFGENESLYSLGLVQQLRKAGIRAAVYPDDVKIKKQMSYANDTKAEFVCTIGTNEMSAKTVGVKNMQTGEQVTLPQEDFLKTYLS